MISTVLVSGFAPGSGTTVASGDAYDPTPDIAVLYQEGDLTYEDGIFTAPTAGFYVATYAVQISHATQQAGHVLRMNAAMFYPNQDAMVLMSDPPGSDMNYNLSFAGYNIADNSWTCPQVANNAPSDVRVQAVSIAYHLVTAIPSLAF